MPLWYRYVSHMLLVCRSDRVRLLVRPQWGDLDVASKLNHFQAATPAHFSTGVRGRSEGDSCTAPAYGRQPA